MVKAIKEIKIMTKRTKKNKEYKVLTLLLSNGRVVEKLLNDTIVALIEEVGFDKVKFEYVSRVSDSGVNYNAIEVSIEELGFTELIFLDRATTILINLLNNKK